jgi:hypothetical protein
MSFISRGVIFLLTIGFFFSAGPLMAMYAPFNPSPFPDDDSPPIIQLNELPQTPRDPISPQEEILNLTLLHSGLNQDSVQNLVKHKYQSSILVSPVQGFTLLHNAL